MKTNQHKSARSQRNVTAFSSFGLETLESRQLMSATLGVASVGSIGAVAALQTPAISMTRTPAVKTATALTLSVKSASIASPVKNVVVQVTAAKTSGQTSTPPPAGNTVEARSIWGAIKSAAKWVKDHVVIGVHKIGIKGTF